MKILSIDTSTKSASVSIINEDNSISKKIDNEITHSEKLLPLIDECLKEANISINDINTFACTIGPGSFTGIRIGIATVKAFAKVNSANIFAISTLDALAYSKANENINYAVSIMDAKNDRIYYRVYKLEYLKYYLDTLPVLTPLCDCDNLVISEAFENIQDILSKSILDTPFTNKNIAFICLENIFEERILDKFEDIFEIDSISVLSSSISTDTIIDMYKNYSILGYDKEYLCTYATLDAIYARKSQAERTISGEK